MKSDFDVIVVGIGAMGASTCFHLADRGCRVLGLEQFDIPHALGSSHGYSRMIRTAYYEHPDYVPLVRQAYRLWAELEDLSQRKLLHLVGGLYMGPWDQMLVAGSRRAAELHNLRHELFTAEEVHRRWSQFVIPGSWQALFEPDAGFLLPEKVISTYAELALRRGAEIHGREAVRAWDANEKGIRVRTDRSDYGAAHLVLAGGAWSGKLLADLGIPLDVTRQVLGWVWPRDPGLFEIGRLPVWGIDSGDGGIYYGFPMTAEVPGFKVAHHLPGEQYDPNTPTREPAPVDEQDFRPALKYIPAADGPVLAMRVCMYTNSPDGHFIVDHHPMHRCVQFACGFSGHGFKFASVIGKILADRVTQPSSWTEANFLRLGRLNLPAGCPTS